MHYFKFNIGDYHKKAGRLTMIEHGAYTLLLHACYDRECFPTKEEAIDWCWARTSDEVAAVEFVLGKFFRLDDGRYVQDRIMEEIEAYHEKAEKNRHIALEREEKRRTKQARNVHDTSPETHEAPPNQEPVNQEPMNQVKKTLGVFTPEFEEAWAIYPKRAGGNSKRDAFKAWEARTKAGVPTDVMLEGVKRYAEYAKAMGSVGTQYVKQAATFFGPGEHFRDDWTTSAPQQSSRPKDPRFHFDTPEYRAQIAAQSEKYRGNYTPEQLAAADEGF